MTTSRYFAFQQQPGQEFIFELTDPTMIDKALNIVAGKKGTRYMFTAES
jgi:hypothetical protein